MAELTLSQNPSIADTIIFELQTPGLDGSLNPANFLRVDNISIFYVERGFQGNGKQVDEKIYDPTKTQALQKAEQEYVINPSEENLTALQDAQRDYNASGIENTFYYDEAQPVHILGTANHPAWQTSNPEASLLVKVDQEDDGFAVPTYFKYYWKPDKAREGDYFICWTWTPSSLAPNEKNSAHLRFWLNGNTQITTSIPSHLTKPEKYQTLLERYTPELFKLQLRDDDRSPDVIDKFNKSVASGFTNLEDLANQLIDLLDANAIHENLISYLSNFFGLKLKSTDPTKWRAQIKRAVPLYKAKGTRSALNEAFDNSAIKLVDLTIPWQVTSSYTWQESFYINESDNLSWTPKFTPISIESAWIRTKSTNYNWQLLPSGFTEIESVPVGAAKTITNIAISSGGNSTITCVGHGLSSDDVILISGSDSTADIDGTWTITVSNEDEFTIPSSSVSVAGNSGTFQKVGSYKLKIGYAAIGTFDYGNDQVRFLYRFGTPPDEELEDYLLSLPLMDNRDDYFIRYPYQNWNVRLIEETDPNFDALIPNREPFHSPLIYGKIRTEFPYSENVYNMEEYNGSNRDSLIPCDIDRFFRDECSACRSSCYNVDLEIENLSDDRIFEAKDILKEFMPFHAVLNNMNFYGAVNDFTQSPVETISISVVNDFEENVTHNQDQFWFNRVTGEFLRSELAVFDSFNPIYNLIEIATSGPSTTQITISNIIISEEIQQDSGGDITSNFTLNNTDIVSESPTGTIYDGTTAVATFTVDSSGNLVLTEVPVAPIGTNNVYIFTDSYYVWYSANLMAVMDLIGISYVSFTGVSEANWTTAATNADIIMIPRIEPNDLLPDLSSGARTVIENFVSNGGTLIMFEPTSGDVVDIMSEIFGQAIDWRALDPPFTLTDEGACVIPGLPSTLNDNSYVGNLDSNPSLLLPGSISLYSGVDPASYDEYDPTVAVKMPYGDGKIFVLGWDWYDAQPLGSQDGGWNALLQAILEFNISTTPNPNVVSGTLNYSTGEVSLIWNCDPGPNSIEISYELSHDLSDEDYVFIDGTDSDNLIDGFWQITYVSENVFSIETDTVTIAGEVGTITKAEYENLSGVGYNEDIMVFCPASRLDVIGMEPDSSARMQILGAGGLAGFYVVKDPVGKTMIVELDSGVPTPQNEPIVDPMTFFEEVGGDQVLNDDTFTFNLFNIIADGEGLCSVHQDNIVMFGDDNNDFKLLSIKKYDENDPTEFWKILISGTEYQIKEFLPDGRLILGPSSPVDNLQSLTSASNITYGIRNEDGATVSWTNQNTGNVVSSSNTGKIEVFLRGRVTPGEPTETYPGIGAIINTINSSSYYFFINTTEYKIIGLKQDSINIFYIEGYNLGDLGSSVNLRINERILTNEIGYFSYQGMKIQVDGDLETDLAIQNGANSLVPEDERVNNNRFKENFLVVVDEIPYFMTEIDGNNLDYPGKTIITLSGLRKYWQTIDAGGTPINFSIRNYAKQDVMPNPVFSSLPDVNFEDIDRSGMVVYDETTYVSGLSALGQENGPSDFVQQFEKVTFKIDYKDNENN